MADSINTQNTTYPIPVFYYSVTIDNEEPIAFSEVSGLAIEYETITYKDDWESSTDRQRSWDHESIHLSSIKYTNG